MIETHDKTYRGADWHWCPNLTPSQRGLTSVDGASIRGIRLVRSDIGSKNLIPEKKAKCNDSRVRLRLEPNLSCQTLGYLNTNDCVVIKDRSEEKFEINGEYWYWYKVDYPSLPDGWGYGKYLDIEK